MCHCWLVTGGLRLSANPSYYLILSSEHLAPNLKTLENAPTKLLLRSEQGKCVNNEATFTLC